MARRTATSYRGRTTTAVVTDSDASDRVTGTVVVEDRGMGLAEALILATTVLLIAAILLTDAYLGKRYGEGLFFK